MANNLLLRTIAPVKSSLPALEGQAGVRVGHIHHEFFGPADEVLAA